MKFTTRLLSLIGLVLMFANLAVAEPISAEELDKKIIPGEILMIHAISPKETQIFASTFYDGVTLHYVQAINRYCQPGALTNNSHGSYASVYCTAKVPKMPSKK